MAEHWKMDVSEDPSTVGLSRLSGVNDKVVASSVLGESLSGGSSASLPRVTCVAEAPPIAADLSMDISENPSSVARPSRLGGRNDKIVVSSVLGVIESLSAGPSSSLPLAACFAQAPSIAANSDIAGPSRSGEMNDKIVESSVPGSINSLSAGPSSSLPLAARLAEAPSIAANPPVDSEPSSIAGPSRSGEVNDKIVVSSVPGVIESLSAGPSSSLPLAVRLSEAPSISTSHPADRKCLSALFPVPTSTDIPLNSIISPSSQSRFLLIWNLPAHFVWNSVVQWIETCISYLGKSKLVLERVVRTNQRGEQAFWLAFSSIGGASAFRGVVAGRQAADTQIIKCDFVDGNDYSSASSRSSDFWTPKDGFVAGGSPTAPFPAPSAAEMAAPSLANRLAPFRRRTHRSKKKKVKGPKHTDGLGDAS